MPAYDGYVEPFASRREATASVQAIKLCFEIAYGDDKPAYVLSPAAAHVGV